MFGKSENASKYQRTRQPIVAMAIDFPRGHHIAPHSHRRAQLVYAESGVMTISTVDGQWVVPPTRAVWIPAGIKHAIETSSRLRMRTLYLEESEFPLLPLQCSVVSVTGLLRELILAAVRIPNTYSTGSRDARVMRLIIDEIRTLKVLPLYLPLPRDPRLRTIARQVLGEPASQNDLNEWARVGRVSSRTLNRLFTAELGMSFGRWRQQARLQASLPMLAKGKSILEASLATGYESPSAFAYAFRRCFGTSPTRYFDESKSI